MTTAHVHDHLDRHYDAILGRLDAILRFPSVSTDPAYANGMAATRAFLLQRLTEIGLQDVQLLDGGGHPAVYGAWLGAPGAPTLIVYGHYDVQPADPLELWTSPPFEPVIRDGRIYARGASDVKGSTLIAIETIGAYLAVTGACPVNVKVFIEGEEETGSPSLRTLVERYRPLLAADAMISADGGRVSTAIPTLNTGSRGIAGFEVTVRTAAKDMHSGRFGGAVRNAAHELARLIASLHDADGRIAVEDYLASAPLPSARLRADAAALAGDEAAFYADAGAMPFGDPVYAVRERTTLRPTIEVNGLWSGYMGAGMKTVIPCEAHAKLTMRLVPGQDPKVADAAVRRHLQRQAPEGVTVTFPRSEGGTPAPSLEPGHPLLVAGEAVIERTTGRRPAHARLGGSIPITAIFKEMLGLDTLTFGYALPDENVHAPDEFFRLSSLRDGLHGWTLLLSELAKFEPKMFRS
jgi:acetylornithine deacetylase/succinyl-diaminopimelate desuccinylase-like protein